MDVIGVRRISLGNDGLASIDDLVIIEAGVGNPAVVGARGVIGSKYCDNLTGIWWDKTGDGNLDWTIVPPTSLSPNGEAVDLLPGMPLANVGGVMKKASAASQVLSVVAGLCAAQVSPTLPTNAISYGVAINTTALWDVVTGGSGGLTPGAMYFLSATAGMMTAVAPTGLGQSVVSLGQALDGKTFLVLIAQPLLL